MANCPREAGQPRILRFRDAPSYLGMDRNRFNAQVRPCVTEIPIGKQGIGFDRLELDAWVDDYSHPQRASRTIERRHVMGRKKVPGLVRRGNLWHVDKVIFGRRICQSTGSTRLEDAEEMLAKVMEEARLAQLLAYGLLERSSRLRPNSCWRTNTSALLLTM